MQPNCGPQPATAKIAVIVQTGCGFLSGRRRGAMIDDREDCFGRATVPWREPSNTPTLSLPLTWLVWWEWHRRWRFYHLVIAPWSAGTFNSMALRTFPQTPRRFWNGDWTPPWPRKISHRSRFHDCYVGRYTLPQTLSAGPGSDWPLRSSTRFPLKGRIIDSRPVDSSLALLIGSSLMDMQLMGTAPPCGYALPMMALLCWCTGNEAQESSSINPYGIGRSLPCLASTILMPTGSKHSCSWQETVGPFHWRRTSYHGWGRSRNWRGIWWGAMPAYAGFSGWPHGDRNRWGCR